MSIENLTTVIQSPLITVSSLVFAALSIILAIAFYFKSKRFKKACYSIASRTLIEGTKSDIGDISILFKNTPCERITVSKLGIWNAGTEPIRNIDIAKQSPIAIKVNKDASVLSASIIFSSCKSNCFAIGEIEKLTDGEVGCDTSISISFDFLDPKQGAVVQIIHTGEWTHKIEVIGKIIGIESLEYIPSSEQSHTRRINEVTRIYGSPKNFIKIMLGICFAITSAGLLSVIFPLSGVIIAAFGIMLAFFYLIDYRSGMPKEISENLKYLL